MISTKRCSYVFMEVSIITSGNSVLNYIHYLNCFFYVKLLKKYMRWAGSSIFSPFFFLPTVSWLWRETSMRPLTQWRNQTVRNTQVHHVWKYSQIIWLGFFNKYRHCVTKCLCGIMHTELHKDLSIRQTSKSTLIQVMIHPIFARLTGE